MKFFLIYICVFVAFQHNFATSTPIPPDKNNPITSKISVASDTSKANTPPSTDLISSKTTVVDVASDPSKVTTPPSTDLISSEISTNIPPQPQSRNMQFGDSQESIVILTPLEEKYGTSLNNQPTVVDVEPIAPMIEPYRMEFDDGFVSDPISQDALIIPQPVNNFENLPVVVNPPDDSDDEDMETAQQIVFRPLFAYRKQTAQRRRIYSNPSSPPKGYEQRRQSYSSYGYPNYYPSNYYKWC